MLAKSLPILARASHCTHLGEARRSIHEYPWRKCGTAGPQSSWASTGISACAHGSELKANWCSRRGFRGGSRGSGPIWPSSAKRRRTHVGRRPRPAKVDRLGSKLVGPSWPTRATQRPKVALGGFGYNLGRVRSNSAQKIPANFSPKPKIGQHRSKVEQLRSDIGHSSGRSWANAGRSRYNFGSKVGRVGPNWTNSDGLPCCSIRVPRQMCVPGSGLPHDVRYPARPPPGYPTMCGIPANKDALPAGCKTACPARLCARAATPTVVRRGLNKLRSLHTPRRATTEGHRAPPSNPLRPEPRSIQGGFLLDAPGLRSTGFWDSRTWALNARTHRFRLGT